MVRKGRRYLKGKGKGIFFFHIGSSVSGRVNLGILKILLFVMGINGIVFLLMNN